MDTKKQRAEDLQGTGRYSTDATISNEDAAEARNTKKQRK